MKTIESFAKEKVRAVSKEIPSEGFVIEEVEMKDFMRYLSKTDPPLIFPRKFTVITGKTGAGKSTILDAITFALYKRTSRTELEGVNIPDVCRKGGYVKVIFLQGGDRYEVRRGLTSKGTPFLELVRNESTISGNIPELDRIIKDVVGLDYDGFRNSTFVRQDEMKQLGAETGAKRLEIFQKLFRLEIFEKAQSLVKEKSHNLQMDIKSCEGEIKTKREIVEKLPNVKRSVREAGDEVTQYESRMKEVRTKLEEAEELLKQLEQEHEDFLRVRSNIETKRGLIEEIERKLEEKRKEGSEAEDLRKKIQQLQKETESLDELSRKAEELRELQRATESIEKERRIYEENRSDANREYSRKRKHLEERLHEAEERIHSLSTDIDKDQAFSLLRREGALGERILRIEKELDWLSDRKDIIRQISGEKEEAEVNLKRVKEKVARINEDSFSLTEIQNQVSQLRNDIEAEESQFKDKIAQIERKIESLDEDLSKLGFDSRRKSELQSTQEKIDEMAEKREQLSDMRRRFDEMGDLSKVIEELEGQLRREQEGLGELLRREQELMEKERQFLQKKSVVDELRKQKETLSGTIARKKETVRILQEQLNELEEESSRLQELEEETENMRSRLEVFALLKESIFHKKGVVMYAINQLLPELEIESSGNLIDLTDGRFTRVKLETHEEAKGYGIQIRVEGVDGRWHDIAEFSGGEKTQINAALRFAIARQLASLPQVGRTYGRMKTLFIDEGDLGSLDTESNRDLFIQKLFKMGEFFDKVILITHLAEVAEKFPGRIRVSMTPEQESKIEVVS